MESSSTRARAASARAPREFQRQARDFAAAVRAQGKPVRVPLGLVAPPLDLPAFDRLMSGRSRIYPTSAERSTLAGARPG